MRALEHFDDLYEKVYEKAWPSIRLGLLSQQKYVAIINNYSDKDKISTKLQVRKKNMPSMLTSSLTDTCVMSIFFYNTHVSLNNLFLK